MKLSLFGAIILLFDIHKCSVEAITKIVNKLQSEGYYFVNVEFTFTPSALKDQTIIVF